MRLSIAQMYSSRFARLDRSVTISLSFVETPSLSRVNTQARSLAYEKNKKEDFLC